MNLDDFFEKPDYSPEIDAETRRRIRVSVAAYAYEYLSRPVMSDADFDEVCMEIDLSINTRRPDMDEWFKSNFEPCTGQWIHNHPELNKLETIALKLLANQF